MLTLTIFLITSKAYAVKDIYRAVKSLDQIQETKLTMGAHDILAIAECGKKNELCENLSEEIKKIRGVEDFVIIPGVQKTKLENLA